MRKMTKENKKGNVFTQQSFGESDRISENGCFDGSYRTVCGIPIRKRQLPLSIPPC